MKKKGIFIAVIVSLFLFSVVTSIVYVSQNNTDYTSTCPDICEHV